MTTMQYSEFSGRIYGKTYQASVPSHGHFELTFRCPLKCGFCYCSCYTSPEHTRNELSTAEVLAILDQAAEGGCLWMTFSGGDPFVRADFRAIYDHARGLGMILNILCSGVLLTDEWLQHLQHAPPLKIEIPLYGITAETHEAVSGKKGTFAAVMKNIRRLLEAEVPLRIKTKITTQNLREVKAVEKFVEEELGLSFNPNHLLYPRLNGDRAPIQYRLSPAQVVEMEQEFGKVACESTTENQGADTATDKLFRCAAGINSFYINPYGEMNFCTYVRTESWSLRTGLIGDGVKHLKQTLLTRTLPKESSCVSCSIQSSCDNCPGRAVLETGSLEGKSEYLCDLNHAVRGKEKHGT